MLEYIKGIFLLIEAVYIFKVLPYIVNNLIDSGKENEGKTAGWLMMLFFVLAGIVALL